LKIFEGFLVLVLVSFLWMLPVSEAIYNYRTDVREDTFHIITTVGQTTVSVALIRPVYQDDFGTVSVSSNCSSDALIVESYTAATRLVSLSGLADGESRLLTVSYDVDALAAHSAINTFLNWLPGIWILILFVFPVAVIYVIVRRR
jgi:hypothetical protein